MELIILFLLQIKHWYVDFVNQSAEELAYKGTYMEWRGLTHSIKHGLLTALILIVFIVPEWALLLGALDFIAHYHIDWYKMNYGATDIKTKQYWNHFGLDQMAHQFTYIMIVWSLT